MIVDDSASMRTLLKRMLHACGWGSHPVVEARDGRHAIDIYRKEKPGLILMDWDMPTVSGMDLLLAFKRHGFEVPIGMVTAKKTAAHRAEAKAAGAEFLLGKPFSRAEMNDALSPYLGRIATWRQEPQDAVGGDTPTGLLEAVVQSIGMLVTGVRVVEPHDGCDVTGSAGLVFSVEADDGSPRFVIALDSDLASALSAGFGKAYPATPSAEVRRGRAAPAMQEDLKEFANILRGVCADVVHRELTVGAMAFRADRSLVSEPWQMILGSGSFKEATRLNIGLSINSFGEGGLSIYQLKAKNP